MSLFGMFTPLDTSQISEGLWTVRNLNVNAYILSVGDRYLIIDTCSSAKALRVGFETLGLLPEKVCTVLLTHTDPDHIGGLALFDHAEVYLGTEEELLLSGSVTRFPGIRYKPLGRPYHLLSDGESIMVNGVKVTAIATPGHTVGHTAYCIDDTQLFTGDALRIVKGELRPFFRFISMDNRTLEDSVMKIRELEGITLIATGHTGVLKLD